MARSEPVKEGGGGGGADAGKDGERSCDPGSCEVTALPIGSLMLVSLEMVLMTVRVGMSGSAPVRESSVCVHVHETKEHNRRIRERVDVGRSAQGNVPHIYWERDRASKQEQTCDGREIHTYH